MTGKTIFRGTGITAFRTTGIFGFPCTGETTFRATGISPCRLQRATQVSEILRVVDHPQFAPSDLPHFQREQTDLSTEPYRLCVIRCKRADHTLFILMFLSTNVNRKYWQLYYTSAASLSYTFQTHSGLRISCKRSESAGSTGLTAGTLGQDVPEITGL